MKCDHCDAEITEDESRAHLRETLCDDCYLVLSSKLSMW